MNIKQVKSLLERLKKLRAPFEDVWYAINKVYSPFLINETGSSTGTSPIEINDDIFDSTGSDSKRVQTEGLIGYLMNPASPWFSLNFEDKNLGKSQAAKEWLDSVEEFFQSAFPKSNFYNANSMFLDQGQHNGTAFLFPEFDGEKIFNFKNFNVMDIFIDENSKDNVDKVVIKQIMTTENIIAEYDKVPKEVSDTEDKNPYQEWIVYICVYPNKDYDATKLDSFKHSSMHWIDGVKEDEAIVRESGYATFPMISWRMFKIPTLAWGYGTCLEALPEVEKLNLVERDLLTASSKSVNPTMAIPQEMEDDDVDFAPNGVMTYTDKNRLPVALNQGVNYPIGKDVKEDYRRRVQNIFKVDFFRLLQTMSERAMTATQVNEMANEKAATIGVMVARIITEYLNPLFDRLIEISFQNNLLPPVPAELVQNGYTFDKIKVDYSGVLAQMQKRFSSVINTNQIVQAIAVLGQIDPTVYDNIDVDVMAREIVTSSNVKSTAIRTEDLVLQIRQQRAQAQQAQMAMQQAQVEADAYNKTSKAPEQGSGAEKLMEQ